MVTLISYPDALSLSQNLKKIVASADGQSAFLLYKNGELVIDETYFPDESGTIEIDIRELVTSLLSVSVPTSDTFTQNNSVADFTATIGDKEIVFRTVKGGIAGSTLATDWLTANFLTWQPQIKSVTYMQPEWLTYYAQEDCQIKCRLYNQDNSNTDIILATISAGQCISVNTQFARIINLNETAKLAYYDIWVEDLNSTRLTYVQRYLLRENTSQENYFIFENSVGGMDAVSFTGSTNLEAETEHELASMDDTSIQASQKMHPWKQQSTGYKSTYEAKWLQDFFTSSQRFHCIDGQIKEIVLQGSAISDSSSEAVKEYSFTYRSSDDRGLLQLDRDMAMPANIEFPTADQIFFLAPRLSDFPEVEVNQQLIVPVQSPYENVWYRISIGSIKTIIQEWTKLNTTELKEYLKTNGYIQQTALNDYAKASDIILKDDLLTTVTTEDGTTAQVIKKSYLPTINQSAGVIIKEDVHSISVGLNVNTKTFAFKNEELNIKLIDGGLFN